ncbi:type 4a pilus biogenesis protein PilO [Photobacterium ganghwense]|uniref:type 4a pilus biogenesis protein PilO n=1 Tax=Photobacterium ganghwense TaxID=320778 RepID=UPI00405604DF
MADWQDLELDEMLEWPLPAQGVVVFLVACVVAALGYWYWIIPMQDELEGLKQQETSLRQDLIRRANQVAALPKVQAQVEALQAQYQQVIRQLPEEQELASLLADVNDIGVRNGLSFQRIEWAPRIDHPLYIELPISIELTGEYEDIGKFAEEIASLSRIVSLKDIDLERIEEQQELLRLKVSATTYRFKAPAKERA